RRAREHVTTHLRVGRKPAGNHAEDEPEGDQAHVEECDLFQLEAVGEVLDEVESRDAREGYVQLEEASTQRREDEEDGKDLRQGPRYSPAGDGTTTFHRMHAIRFDVDQVVDRVDGACEEREYGGGEKRLARDLEIQSRVAGERVSEKIFVKDHGRHHEQVL